MRAAWTLIELLIVIAAIAVLLCILLPVAGLVRNAARWTITETRMQDLLTAIGASEADPALSAELRLRRTVALGGLDTPTPKTRQRRDMLQVEQGSENLGGTLRVEDWGARLLNTPVTELNAGGWYSQADYDLPHILGHPWDQPDDPDRIHAYQRYPLIEADAAADAGCLAQMRFEPTRSSTVRLDQLWPLKSAELINASGLLTDVALANGYYADRSSKRSWNDAWGRPLVVAYAVFQPPPVAVSSHSTVSKRDRWLDAVRLSDAHRAFGHSGAVYLAVGAVGPNLPASLTEAQLASSLPTDWTSTILPSLWTNIATTCGAAEWTGASFAAPPWAGIRRRSANGLTCAITAPRSVR